MLNPVIHKLKWSYRKNIFDIRGLLFQKYPGFIFESEPQPLKDEIPVFTFHSVKMESFQEQLEFLYNNGYRTLSADEFYDILVGQKPVPENSVVLTFDDGWGSLWAIAYPLLEGYGFRAVSFLIPGLIVDDATYHPNLKDVWRNKKTVNKVEEQDNGHLPLATWQEIETMHQSGVMDFQAHTMYHSLIFTSPKLVDFINPRFDFYRFGNINVPIFSTNGQDNVRRTADWGTPIYESEPRLFTQPRYYDNEQLRQRCIQFVKENGGLEFFKQRNWRQRLHAYFQKAQQELGRNGHFETLELQTQAILEDLQKARCEIERRLPGKQVRHVCYPWFMGCQLSVEMSKKAGYVTNFWGSLQERKTNRPGDDPFHVCRLEDGYIFRLPGIGRKSLKKLISQKFQQNWSGFIKNSQAKKEYTVTT